MIAPQTLALALFAVPMLVGLAIAAVADDLLKRLLGAGAALLGACAALAFTSGMEAAAPAFLIAVALLALGVGVTVLCREAYGQADTLELGRSRDGDPAP